MDNKRAHDLFTLYWSEYGQYGQVSEAVSNEIGEGRLLQRCMGMSDEAFYRNVQFQCEYHPERHLRANAPMPPSAQYHLSAREYRLYAHYAPICAVYDVCVMSDGSLARALKMSPTTVKKARLSLAEKGYIRILQEGGSIKGQRSRTTVIELV